MKGISTQKCFPTSKLAKTKMLQHQKQNPKQHIVIRNFYCNREPFLFSVMMCLVVACSLQFTFPIFVDLSYSIYIPYIYSIYIFISLNASFDEACSSWQIKYRSNLSSLTYGTTSNLISDMQFYGKTSNLISDMQF